MADGYESHRSMMVKVGIFTVTMLLVAAGLVVIFGEFRFGPATPTTPTSLTRRG